MLQTDIFEAAEASLNKCIGVGKWTREQANGVIYQLEKILPLEMPVEMLEEHIIITTELARNRTGKFGVVVTLKATSPEAWAIVKNAMTKSKH